MCACSLRHHQKRKNETKKQLFYFPPSNQNPNSGFPQVGKAAQQAAGTLRTALHHTILQYSYVKGRTQHTNSDSSQGAVNPGGRDKHKKECQPEASTGIERPKKKKPEESKTQTQSHNHTRTFLVHCCLLYNFVLPNYSPPLLLNPTL